MRKHMQHVSAIRPSIEITQKILFTQKYIYTHANTRIHIRPIIIQTGIHYNLYMNILFIYTYRLTIYSLVALLKCNIFLKTSLSLRQRIRLLKQRAYRARLTRIPAPDRSSTPASVARILPDVGAGGRSPGADHCQTSSVLQPTPPRNKGCHPVWEVKFDDLV